MGDDEVDVGKDVQSSSEEISSASAAGDEGGLRCTPCGHGAGIAQKAARSPGKPTSKEVEGH